MNYNSTSKGKSMPIEDMHMMHLENVLLKDLRVDNLNWYTQAAILSEYITKVRANREHVNRLLRIEKGTASLLLDLLKMPVGYQKPVKGASVSLELYRQTAMAYIRIHGRISADQLRAKLEKDGYTVDGQTLTHVFRDKRFEQVGYRRSSFAGAKGRFINNWTVAAV